MSARVSRLAKPSGEIGPRGPWPMLQRSCIRSGDGASAGEVSSARQRAAGNDFTALPLTTSALSGSTWTSGDARAAAEVVRLQALPGPQAPAPAKAAATPALSVDKIDVITSATGAIGGYPAITSGDLNSPGPWNSAATGGVSNVHQIHFHVDNGDSAALVPTRTARATFQLGNKTLKFPADQVMAPGQSGPPAPGGFGGVLDHLDGPAAHETKRPTKDKIVVADGPGAGALSASQVPFKLDSDFTLKVSSAAGADIASIRYTVRIEKASNTNAANAANSITAVEKKDLVRGRAL